MRQDSHSLSAPFFCSIFTNLLELGTVIIIKQNGIRQTGSLGELELDEMGQ